MEALQDGMPMKRTSTGANEITANPKRTELAEAHGTGGHEQGSLIVMKSQTPTNWT
jgi:hypothetical protein